MKKYFTLISFLLVSFASHTSHAQFAGDVFFDSPSVAVSQNGTVELSLSAFSGAYVFGAAQVSLTFDPQKLEIVSVIAGAAKEIQPSFSYKLSSGRVGILVLNSDSLSQPIGTVNLAKIKVRSIAPVATYTTISTQVHTILRQDSTAFSSPQGYSAEILTTASTVSTSAIRANMKSLSQSNQTDEDLEMRALQLRPEGALVKLKQINNSVVSEAVVQTGSRTEETIEN